jgi:ABC-type transporter Mla maintaining outer membrane lipid asymmetry permease subunit MlaE
MDQSITQLSLEAMPAHLGHFAVASVYGLLILAVVYRLRTWRAIVAGIVVSLVLYGINFAAFRMFAPQFTGPWEFNVALAHVLFGGITAGVIRGFLRPPMSVDESQPNPGPRYP